MVDPNAAPGYPGLVQMPALPKSFGVNELRTIIESTREGIMVTDNVGNVILANSASVQFMERKADEVIGQNVRSLVGKGFYNRSTVLECMETRSIVTRVIELASGKRVMSTSVPITDSTGEVIMVVTTTRHQELVDVFADALARERERSDQYRSVIDYFGRVKCQSQKIVSESPMMREVVTKAKAIAATDSTVLLQGETGTGKDVIARYIHHHSNRAAEPFISVNCAAIPHELVESEFFGYEKGAFSGAGPHGKPGFFEMANRGTLFLDEVADLPLGTQPKLLRVLETGEVRRLGGTSTRAVDVRLIAATNKDLKQMVRENLFRSDLYYRLNVVPIVLPPLRERPEDILALAQEFLQELNRKYGFGKKFTQGTISAFLEYDWPGNARELRNVIERLVVTSNSDELHWSAETTQRSSSEYRKGGESSRDSQYKGSLKAVMRALEQEYIRQVLKECNGHVGKAADRLGIHRTQLYRKLHQRSQ